MSLPKPPTRRKRTKRDLPKPPPSPPLRPRRNGARKEYNWELLARAAETGEPLPSPRPILKDFRVNPHDPSAAGRVYASTSTVAEGAGLGAFAAISFDTDDIICEYFGSPGHPITPRQAKHPNYQSDYVYVEGDIAVDAQHPITKEVLSAAGHINDDMDETTTNCRFLVKNGKVFIVATRPIAPHEELTILYAAHYWMSSRWSLSILRKAKAGYSTPATEQVWEDLIHHA